MRPTTQAPPRLRESSRSPARWHTIGLVFERSHPGGSPTIESSTARNRPYDWAERREPVTQCCRSRHRLVLKGCDVRKPSPPPAMVAGFSYGVAGGGLARYSAPQHSSIAAFGISDLCRCGEQTSPRKRDRRGGTAAFKCVHAPRPPNHFSAAVDTASPAGAPDAGPFAPTKRVPHASVGMAPTSSRPRARLVEATGASLSGPRAPLAHLNAQPGPSAGCPDRSMRSPPQKAPSTASAAPSTMPTPGAPGRIGPRGATVEAAAGRSAMSTVRRS